MERQNPYTASAQRIQNKAPSSRSNAHNTSLPPQLLLRQPRQPAHLVLRGANVQEEHGLGQKGVPGRHAEGGLPTGQVPSGSRVQQPPLLQEETARRGVLGARLVLRHQTVAPVRPGTVLLHRVHAPRHVALLHPEPTAHHRPDHQLQGQRTGQLQ